MQTELRTKEERRNAVYARAGEIKAERLASRIRAIEISSVAASVAAVLALAFIMPSFIAKLMTTDGVDGMRGSIISGSNALGFAVVGIVAFMLGLAVTILCFRLEKYKRTNSPGEEEYL